MDQQTYNFWSLTISGGSAVISLTVGVVIFWYTRETQKLRKASEAQVEQMKSAERERERNRPVLSAETIRRPSPVHVTALEGGHEVLRTGLGCYITLTLVNVGRTTAFKCQPVLTMIYRKGTTTGDYEAPEEWIPVSSWIPLPLRWALDELNVKVQGIPTADRDLVPQRPYMFDLGGCSSFNPNALEISATIFPLGQETTFQPGAERCFEITVFADNAPPLKKWIWVHWKGGFSIGDGHGQVDAGVIRNPPLDLISRLNFDELDTNPCSM